MKTNKAWLAGVGILMLLGIFLAQRHLTQPKMNLRPSNAVGEALAEEMGRLLGGAGTVVVIGRAAAQEEPGASREQISSFTTVLARRGSPKLATTEWLARPEGRGMDTGTVTGEQLGQFLDKHPQANAFVIFAGLPPLSSVLAEKIARRSLKVLAVCGYGSHLRSWLETRSLAVAVVPRFGEPPAPRATPKSPREWLRQEFEWLTPESVGQLPY